MKQEESKTPPSPLYYQEPSIQAYETHGNSDGDDEMLIEKTGHQGRENIYTYINVYTNIYVTHIYIYILFSIEANSIFDH